MPGSRQLMVSERDGPSKNCLEGHEIEPLSEIRSDLFETGVPAAGVSDPDERLKDRDALILRMLGLSEELKKRSFRDHPIGIADVKIDVFGMRIQKLSNIALLAFNGNFPASIKNTLRMTRLKSLDDLPLIRLELSRRIGQDPKIGIRELIPRKGILDPFEKPVGFVTDGVDDRGLRKFFDEGALQCRFFKEWPENAQNKKERHVKE